MARRALIACHDLVASGGDILSTAGDDFTYDFIDTQTKDYRDEFIRPRMDDYVMEKIDEWNKAEKDWKDEDVDALYDESLRNPAEYDRLAAEYTAKYPDRKQYHAWSEVPSDTYDIVFGMYCPVYSGAQLKSPFDAIRKDSLRALKPGGSFLMTLLDTKRPTRDEYDPKILDAKFPTPAGFVRTETKLAKGKTDPNFPEFWEMHNKYPYTGKNRWVVKYTRNPAGGKRRKTRRVKRRVRVQTFRTTTKHVNKNGY
jgi:hypothetical protein